MSEKMADLKIDYLRKINLHSSGIINYKTCPRKFYYADMQRLRPIKPDKNLFAGRCLHKMLDAHYLGSDDPVEVFDRYVSSELALLPMGYDIDDVMDETNLVRSVGKEYIDYSAQGEPLEVMEVDGETMVEKEFNIPVVPPGVKSLKRIRSAKASLNGRYDLIVKDVYDNIWIVDHKTARSFPNEEVLRLDVQMGYYMLAASWIFGKQLKGIIYNVLRKTNPKTARTDIFKRYKIIVNHRALSNIQHDLYWTYRAMIADRQFLRAPGPINFNCTLCSYRDICIADMEGRGTESYIGSLYEVKEGDDRYIPVVESI